jgi:hypothetical protein
VYPILPVSKDCPFLIAPSVFSNVYLQLDQPEIKTAMFVLLQSVVSEEDIV